MQYVAIGARCLIGIVFLVSFIGKVAGRDAFGAFTRSIRDMRLPANLARPAAVLVVVAEFAVWVLLAVPLQMANVAGFVLAVGLLVAFAIAIALTVRRGARVPCRCFGRSAVPVGPRNVVRNGVLAALAAVGAGAASAGDPVDAGGLVLAMAGGLVLGGLITGLESLMELFRPIDKIAGTARVLR